MKINRNPLISKLALVSAAVCAAVLAFTPNANALNLALNDQRVVGTVSSGNPPNAQTAATWINYMITLGLNGSGNIGNQQFTRSNNMFANLPNANPNVTATGSSNSINLGAGGVYTYLFVQYSFLGFPSTSVVWNVAGLSGNITIPILNGISLLSSWILFGPTGGGVPDGGTTVMLLGAALGALGMARRFLRG
jgi:VPDSG-CTERM motif